METNKKEGMQTVINMYDWHSKLFKNVIDNITDKDAQNRFNTKANHVAWIAGSLVQGRFSLGNLLGLDLKQTSDELFKNNKGIQDNTIYPSLDEYRKDWEKITPVLKDALNNVSEEKLNSPDPWEMPGGPFTFLDTIIACTDRESYCIGQIGLWRRLL
jgi:hypothetical protein